MQTTSSTGGFDSKKYGKSFFESGYFSDTSILRKGFFPEDSQKSVNIIRGCKGEHSSPLQEKRRSHTAEIKEKFLTILCEITRPGLWAKEVPGVKASGTSFIFF
ncbi:hypothetical protein [uncultured Neglectibacter sp.]|uniref:hypothetical protein n=1 Tax=uncultured Neglectibacter sp. TaxID=1924108 RepID=UPI0034DF0EB7